MAHFAQLDKNNIVTQVIVVNDAEITDVDGIEKEHLGVTFCQNLFGGNWKQTSYHSNIRKNYAGVGNTYDASRDAFYAPQPYPSWLLNETTCQWFSPVLPVPMPIDGNIINNRYIWNETEKKWDKLNR